MKRRRKNERGATTVEAAISYGLLFLAMFAIVEFGLAFKDWTSVTHAARAGARAGATFGSNPATDILVLREIQDVLAVNGMPAGTQVNIFEAAPGGDSTPYIYSPNYDCATDAGWSGTPNPLPGCCDWNPCPEPGRPTYEPDCVAFPGTCAPRWPVDERDIEAPGTDRIGVEIVYSHEWITGLFMDTTDLTTSADFQIEPEVFGPTS